MSSGRKCRDGSLDRALYDLGARQHRHRLPVAERGTSEIPLLVTLGESVQSQCKDVRVFGLAMNQGCSQDIGEEMETTEAVESEAKIVEVIT